MIIQDYSDIEDSAAAARDDDNDDGNEKGEEEWFIDRLEYKRDI